ELVTTASRPTLSAIIFLGGLGAGIGYAAMTVRGATLFVSACLFLIALLLAVIPFTRQMRGINVALDCHPPLAAAWVGGHRDQLSLWVVTVGDKMAGDNGDVRVVGDVGPWCRAPARERLLVSSGLVVAAAVVATLGWVLRRNEPLVP